jgi:phage N-6-adenine-methyltransferase
MVSPALLTSNNQNWETPPALFEYLHKIHNFTLDACALPENTKLPNYFTPEQDGLKQSWKGEMVWVNPPYTVPKQPCKANCKKKYCEANGHREIYEPGQIDWVKKAHDEYLKHAFTNVVMLLPARTDTRIFHDFVMLASQITFIRGRLQFVNAPANAVFPSMLVEFSDCDYGDKFTTLNLKEIL